MGLDETVLFTPKEDKLILSLVLCALTGAVSLSHICLSLTLSTGIHPYAIRHGGGGFKNLTALDLGEHKRRVGGRSFSAQSKTQRV